MTATRPMQALLAAMGDLRAARAILVCGVQGQGGLSAHLCSVSRRAIASHEARGSLDARQPMSNQLNIKTA